MCEQAANHGAYGSSPRRGSEIAHTTSRSDAAFSCLGIELNPANVALAPLTSQHRIKDIYEREPVIHQEMIPLVMPLRLSAPRQADGNVCSEGV